MKYSARDQIYADEISILNYIKRDIKHILDYFLFLGNFAQAIPCLINIILEITRKKIHGDSRCIKIDNSLYSTEYSRKINIFFMLKIQKFNDPFHLGSKNKHFHIRKKYSSNDSEKYNFQLR